MGKHKDPSSPKEGPLDPKRGGGQGGSNNDENKTGSGQHSGGKGKGK